MKISKSKQELARIISENGGWCDGEFAAQDGDGTGSIDFFESKPQYHPNSKFWRGVYDPFERIDRADVTIKNFHQTILSRDEYFRLYPAQDADGWIAWKGGKCPVDDAVVCVRFRSGTTNDTGMRASGFYWRHDGGHSDIIAYRLHKPEQAKPEFCESVMRSIPEPEVKPTIEQLAADYRNAKDYAERKQQEADDAKADAEGKLAELIAAGKAIGLVISVSEKDPELVIADWRDLRVGDEVEYVEGSQEWSIGMVGVVQRTDHDDGGDMNVRLLFGDKGTGWPRKWRFIRRP